LFAALYDRGNSAVDRRFSAWRHLIAGGAKGRVLEVGAGTGANIGYYPAGADVTYSEPGRAMRDRLRRKLETAGNTAPVLAASAEALPFDDRMFDTVVITLALCSVRDLRRSLVEVSRVLKPGGELRFVEHIAAERGFWRWFQSAVRPLYTPVAGGCHPDRDTVQAITAAGFEVTDLHRFKFGPYPVRPFVAGIAVKRT
jgi:ubiquinone/menaquinone biosynthesis C-methylase UbiE